jgi:uncharacterized membrane protein YhaH (DUF805 family)
MHLMLEPLRKYAVFVGRARRSEYWLFLLFEFVLQCIPMLLISGLEAEDASGARLPGLVLAVAILLALIAPTVAVGVRRLHDTGRSGWWLLLPFLPLLGTLVLLVFLALPGTRGPNRYGLDPKGDGEQPMTAAA